MTCSASSKCQDGAPCRVPSAKLPGRKHTRWSCNQRGILVHEPGEGYLHYQLLKQHFEIGPKALRFTTNSVLSGSGSYFKIIVHS